MQASTRSSESWRQDLIHGFDIAEETVRSLWVRDEQRLKDAAMELDTDLELFQTGLDKNPRFSGMPRLRDDFDYLWMMLVDWGSPDNWCMDSALYGLTINELSLAFAYSRLKIGRYLCSQRASRHWEEDRARDTAFETLRATKRALEFAWSAGEKPQQLNS